MNTTIIAKYFQLLRKSNNYTQDTLAEKLDVCRQAVSKWETGTAIPDIEILLKLSKLYNLTVNELLEPQIHPQKITEFEQLSSLSDNELREILSRFDAHSLTIAFMGASPTLNYLLENLFPDTDFPAIREEIGQVRIEPVEDMQNEIISIINLNPFSYK